MGNYHIAELRIDLHNLEVHCLAYECVIVADRLDVDLRAREEGLESEYLHDHAALGAGLDVTLDDFVAVVCVIDFIPSLELESLLV